MPDYPAHDPIQTADSLNKGIIAALRTLGDRWMEGEAITGLDLMPIMQQAEAVERILTAHVREAHNA
jgi:hypothetical protein